jgi:predicted transcriptional regulator
VAAPKCSPNAAPLTGTFSFDLTSSAAPVPKLALDGQWSDGTTPQIGYTPGMKIAVSVPDDVFEEAEELARRMKQSRSEVYSRALAEYVARHAPDRVTEAMDRALAEIGEHADQFVRTTSRRVLKRGEW